MTHSPHAADPDTPPAPTNSSLNGRNQRLAAALRSCDWVVTLVAVYVIHHMFVTHFILGNVTDIVRPFGWLPAYVYNGWDGDVYRSLYNHYDRFFWPPLYPFSLRLITFVFGLRDPQAFEKSAVILNLISHAAIIGGIARYLRRDISVRGVAPWVVAFFIFLFPFHNVFFAAYSESFYLAITVCAFLLHQQGKPGAASFLAGMASLIRMMGSFLVVAFVAEQVFYCIRDRRFYWRNLLLASLGVWVVVGWHVILRFLGTTAVGSNADWISDLLTHHVPPGADAKLWVFKYLAFSPRVLEVIAFWLSMLGIAYCGYRKRYAEMFYIGAFNLSLVFYLYRPFAWTRYVSVLFPVQIMIADFLRDKPRVATALLIASAASCYWVQRALFQGQMGEP